MFSKSNILELLLLMPFYYKAMNYSLILHNFSYLSINGLIQFIIHKIAIVILKNSSIEIVIFWELSIDVVVINSFLVIFINFKDVFFINRNNLFYSLSSIIKFIFVGFLILFELFLIFFSLLFLFNNYLFFRVAIIHVVLLVT